MAVLTPGIPSVVFLANVLAMDSLPGEMSSMLLGVVVRKTRLQVRALA